MAYTTKKYGWIPDLPDQRDIIFSAQRDALAVTPALVDLRSQCPPVYDQGQLGSCTANGIGGAIHFERLKQQAAPDFVPSRLFIYYNERVIEHTVQSDAGAQIRDGIKTVAKQGDCPETEWPYDVAKFAHKPSAACSARTPGRWQRHWPPRRWPPRCCWRGPRRHGPTNTAPARRRPAAT